MKLSLGNTKKITKTKNLAEKMNSNRKNDSNYTYIIKNIRIAYFNSMILISKFYYFDSIFLVSIVNLSSKKLIDFGKYFWEKIFKNNFICIN